jgi:hypothetical protein
MNGMAINAKGRYRLTVVDRETGEVVEQEEWADNAITADGKAQLLANIVGGGVGFGANNVELILDNGGPTLVGVATHADDVPPGVTYPFTEGTGNSNPTRRITWRFADITPATYTPSNVTFGRVGSPVFSTAPVPGAWGTKSSRYNWLIDYVLDLSGGPIGNSNFANASGAYNPPSNTQWNLAFQEISNAFITGTPVLGNDTGLEVEGTISPTGTTVIGQHIPFALSGLEATFVFRAGDGVAQHTWNRNRIETIGGLFWHDATDHGAKVSGSVWTYTWKLSVS